METVAELAVLDALERVGVSVWMSGGWGADALLALDLPGPYAPITE